MSSVLTKRLLGVATHVADSRISFDDFIKDVTDAHIGLLETNKDLESVKDLLLRSGHENPAHRLELVQKDLNFALDIFRTLDALYHTGKLRYGPRAPQARQMKKTQGLALSQERPAPGRSTRKLLSRR